VQTTRVGPGAGHHAGAVAGAHLRLVGLDDGVEGGGVDQALPDQQGLQRHDPGGHGVELGAVVVVVVVAVVGQGGA
jgi:hypothetical protein